MKRLILIVTLLGLAIAADNTDAEQASEGSDQHGPNYFKMRCLKTEIDFECEEDEWKPVHMTKWMKRAIGDSTYNVTREDCLDVNATAKIMIKWHREFKNCDARRLAEFFRNAMGYFHAKCLQSREDARPCLHQLYAITLKCVNQTGLIRTVLQEEPDTDKCMTALEATENCVENEIMMLSKEENKCTSAEGAAVAKFLKDLREAVGKKITADDRREMMCRILPALLE